MAHFTPALFPFRWHDAAQHVYDEYLRKPYTSKTVPVDWEYKFDGVTIPRPNHGLAHTLRVASYVSVVVKAYNLFNVEQLTSEDVEHIQLALLFYVVGRENEASFSHNKVEYLRARAKCAEAFENYVNAHPQVITPERREFYKQGILNAYGSSPPQYIIIRICHDLDLIRCYTSDQYKHKLEEASTHVGPAAALLGQLASACLAHTGNRIMNSDAENGPLFIRCSRSVDEALRSIAAAFQLKQRLVLEPLNPPMPEDFQAPIPEAPWQVSPQLRSRVPQWNSEEPYQRCVVLPDDPEAAFVTRYFMHSKPSGYAIRKIYFIHHPNQTSSFESGMRVIEDEVNNLTFAPRWNVEDLTHLRARTIARWQRCTASFSPIMNKVKVLPLWQGTGQKKCESICKSGFTYFGRHHYFNKAAPAGAIDSTDIGYFGGGIYFTNSARYASMYSDGNLILAWVSMREPYPVVNNRGLPHMGDDMGKLKGHGAYQNYNAHYIPVVSTSPDDPNCMNYYACDKDHLPAWDEYVVFNKQQTLPYFWIELGVDTLEHPLPLIDAFPAPSTWAVETTQPSSAKFAASPVETLLILNTPEDLKKIDQYKRVKITPQFAANSSLLADLSKKLQAVTELDCSESELTDQGLVALCPSQPIGLRTLNLTGCDKLTGASLHRTVATFYPNLTSLNLEGCRGITKGFAALKNCSKLTSISLSSCFLLTDEELITLAQSIPGLTSLDLSWCTELTDKALTYLVKTCRSLTSLNLRDCRNLTDAWLADSGILGKRNSLTSLNLTGCYKLTDRGLGLLAKYCPNLSSLELRGCNQITDRGIDALSKGCTRLTSLHLGDCNQITEAGLMKIVNASPLLTTLVLLRWENLTDDGLGAIAQSRPGLTSLSLFGCNKLTDLGLSWLAKFCAGLTTLHLGNCRQISDRGLVVLARSCPNLTFLDLRGFSQLTDSGLMDIANFCPNLTVLDIEGCIQLTAPAIARVKELLPKAKVMM